MNAGLEKPQFNMWGDNCRSPAHGPSPTCTLRQGGCAVAAAAAALSAFGVDSVVRGLEDLQLPCMAITGDQQKARIVKNGNVGQPSAASESRRSGIGDAGGMPVLEHLDLSGCCLITDASLRYVLQGAMCLLLHILLGDA